MNEIIVDGNDVVNKWEGTGLLDATKPDDKNELATLLDKLAQHLVIKQLNKEPDTEEIAGCILPILVVLHNEHRDICPKDMKVLLDDFEKFYNKNKGLIDDLNSYISQNGEKEFCELYVYSLIHNIK